MATNDEKVNGGRVLSMFMTIRGAELKNVRTLEYDDKDMVKMLTKYIMKEANKESTKAGDDD